MAKTVIGLMDNIGEAQTVVRELVDAGINRDDIGFMANEKHAVPDSAALNESEGSQTASGALTGAGTGAAIGGIAGLALSLAPLAIPGIGPILAAGPIAAALAGAGVGAVTGGLIGGLTNLGVPEEEAHYYAEGVRRGGILVTVAADSQTQANAAVTIMRRYGAADIEERATQWKKQGWKGRFEAVSSPVSEQPVQKSVELEESAEEPVVEKRARVVEEVKVGKKRSNKKETIQDTVRRSDVEVQRTGASNQAAYNGPERRLHSIPWNGVERRRAA